MHFIPPDIEAYAAAHTSPESKLLARLNRNTHLQALMPRMLSGHWQGRLLSLISKIVAPERILEIGTYTGYSAICLAEGLAPGGQLVSIEKEAELIAFAQPYIAEAGYADRITLLQGQALAVLPTLAGPFQLVFMDAVKEEYQAYYDLVLPLVPSGGLILTDNVLWSGQVVGKSNDSAAAALRSFNTFVVNDPRVDKVLLPVRDGLYLIRKK